MAMYVYDRIWSNKFNRTMLFSSLMTAWAFFIELYFFFWPKETLQNEFLINILYIKIFNAEIFGWLFHTIVWSVFFFFGWITYTLVKELSRSEAANVTEFAIGAFVFSLFISFMNNMQVAVLFLLFTSGEWLYMYLSLRD